MTIKMKKMFENKNKNQDGYYLKKKGKKEEDVRKNFSNAISIRTLPEFISISFIKIHIHVS
jgi:hypothetical protein